MGCASSKKSRCQHCQSPYTPLPRSYSVPVHHPAERKGDTYHVVALTSTTLGSLKIDSLDQTTHLDCQSSYNDEDEQKTSTDIDNNDCKSKGFSMELIQAKTWSNMINEKIPKAIPRTPIMTPPGEPETINSWELMEGLEDNSPLRTIPNHLDRCFSFHSVSTASPLEQPKPKVQENGSGSPKPLWVRVTDTNGSPNSNIVVKDFDPDIISTFRKALEELSPTSARLRSPESERKVFSIDENLFSVDLSDTNKVTNAMTPTKRPPQGQGKVVIYFTSLRGIRKTYEDCCQVRDILKGFRVRLDERDVSMHNGFREELKELLDGGFRGVLPRVFVNGSYIGGAEEVRQLHEDGELEKILQGCLIGDGECGVCEACGDVRFLPCERCSGSCKIYNEDDDDDDEDGCDEEDELEGGFQRCPDCNENGIVRCPVCCQ